MGFCSYHDNKIFEPIDNFFLEPNLKQIFLYTYRSICREYFFLENSINFLSKVLNEPNFHYTEKDLIQHLLEGNINGFNSLKIHKENFELMTKADDYSKLRFVLYISEKPLTMAFSGILYPDFDFTGKQLQDLSHIGTIFDLISVASTPLEKNRWGYLLSWHTNCEKSCVQLINSISESEKEGKFVSDLLFRLALIASENHSFSPSWFDNLTINKKYKLTEFFENRLDIFSSIDKTYLSKGLEGISEWEFKEKISQLS